MRNSLRTCASFLILATLSLAGCGGVHYSDPQYDHRRPYYENSHRYEYEDRRDWERERWHDKKREKYDRERDRLAEERREIERERRRLEEERERRERHPKPTPVPELRCPPGTRPSTHRCTKEERKRGCKDYGAPDGRGCSNF